MLVAAGVPAANPNVAIAHATSANPMPPTTRGAPCFLPSTMPAACCKPPMKARTVAAKDANNWPANIREGLPRAVVAQIMHTPTTKDAVPRFRRATASTAGLLKFPAPLVAPERDVIVVWEELLGSNASVLCVNSLCLVARRSTAQNDVPLTYTDWQHTITRMADRTDASTNEYSYVTLVLTLVWYGMVW